MVIDSEGQKLVLQKKGAAWELVEPKKLPVDEVVATDLIGAVTGLRASDWVAKDSPDVAKAQFDKPMLTVTFTTAAPATQPTAAATTTAPASRRRQHCIARWRVPRRRPRNRRGRRSRSGSTRTSGTRRFTRGCRTRAPS